MTATSADAAAVAIVAGWIDAFNARDLARLISCTSVDVEVCPIRLWGVQRSYRGHGGIRAWIDDLARACHDERITTSDVRDLGQGRLLVAGVLGLGAAPDDASWCGLYRTSHGRITHVQQYLSEPALLTDLGLLN